MTTDQIVLNQTEVGEILKKGSRKIAPLWSLENFVAVNPYMGMSDMEFTYAMNFLHVSGKAEGTLPKSFYLDAIRKGKIIRSDISEALDKVGNTSGIDVDEFLQQVHAQDGTSDDIHVKTVVDVASEINGKKWHRFMVDRISFWASAYFDNNQAIWNTANNTTSLFAAWKREAAVDFAPEAMGLKGFRKTINKLPDNYLDATSIALERLDIPEILMDHYLNALVMKMNGWAGFAARIDWDANLKGRKSQVLEEFLSIMLVWELCLLETLSYKQLNSSWSQAKQEGVGLISNDEINVNLQQRIILQQSFDISNQRQIIRKINDQKAGRRNKSLPDVQAIFCIDVRSELFRRKLEAAHSNIETLGFAGFFGFPIKYQSLAYDEGEAQCPVLIAPTHKVKERLTDLSKNREVINGIKLKYHIAKAWKSFRSGAISCFGFVSPLGLFFLPKLITDSFGITRPTPSSGEKGMNNQQIASKRVDVERMGLEGERFGISLQDRVAMASSALKAMSLTDNFAPIVLVTGHGASTVNNPHATGLDCGACGGHSGEVNAKVAAAVLNDMVVREKLKADGLEIPRSTIFLPALHDTTTDEVTIFDGSIQVSSWHTDLLNKLKEALKIAGKEARGERARRMDIKAADPTKEIIQRSKDWSQVRPEWGLAGCSSFIIAPRERTKQLDFGAKAFMHNYTWRKDEGFGVLETIMTAPMVVTSWINLQYYASTVDNKRFGSGNKTLHNVVGGVGVLEGFGGDLRVGLPWQSVHDGDKYQHEPQRLNVIIEAPVDEISKILSKHESIRNLCDNQWIFLFAINDEGKVKYKYIGNLEWEIVE